MLRKILFAMVPMALVVSFVSADDTLPEFNLAEISDAAIEIDTASLDGLDVDGLAAEAGEDTEEAVEACFRRFGYRHRGYGYGYGHGCYRPYYSYRHCYPTYYCHRPVYTYPVVSYVSYWGCY